MRVEREPHRTLTFPEQPEEESVSEIWVVRNVDGELDMDFPSSQR